MIRLVYAGRLGNNMFQYAFARILAEKTGRSLINQPIEYFPATNFALKGKSDFTGPPAKITEQKADIDFLLEHDGPIFIDGFYGQRYEYYKESKDKIKRWFSFRGLGSPNVNKKDIAIHIRCYHVEGCHGCTMDTSYYEECIDRISDINKGYENIHIFTDNPDDNFVVRPILKKFNCKLNDIQNPVQSMAHMSAYNNIVISQSSFSWWASFLSESENICFPRPSSGVWPDWSGGDIELEVDDEERYIYVEGKTLGS